MADSSKWLDDFVQMLAVGGGLSGAITTVVYKVMMNYAMGRSVSVGGSTRRGAYDWQDRGYYDSLALKFDAAVGPKDGNNGRYAWWLHAVFYLIESNLIVFRDTLLAEASDRQDRNSFTKWALRELCKRNKVREKAQGCIFDDTVYKLPNHKFHIGKTMTALTDEVIPTDLLLEHVKRLRNGRAWLQMDLR